MKQPRKRTAARAPSTSAPSTSAPTERERSVEKTVEPAADGQSARQEESTPMSVEEIRARAYELYLERGRAPGGALDDWLQAEREQHERVTTSAMQASSSPPTGR